MSGLCYGVPKIGNLLPTSTPIQGVVFGTLCRLYVRHQSDKVTHLMMETTHQLEDLDDAWRRLEIPDVESDLQRLGVGAGVRHHRDVGLGGGLGGQVHRPVTVSVHHPQVSSVPGQMAAELLTRSLESDQVI